MATTNDNSSTDGGHNHDGKTTPSPNEAKFDEAVKALLTENHTHRNLKLRLHQLVTEEAQKLPPIKVLYCASYGGFGCSKAFIAFLHSRSIVSGTDSDELYGWLDDHRSDPKLIQAISDYGRSICDTFPFILDDMRTVYTWKIDKLFAKLKKEFPRVEMEFNPDLVAEATSFINQMSNTNGRWKNDCLGSVPNDKKTLDFEAFTEMHPEFWMAHQFLGSDMDSEPVTFQVAIRFAHVLVHGGNHARYHVEQRKHKMRQSTNALASLAPVQSTQGWPLRRFLHWSIIQLLSTMERRR